MATLLLQALWLGGLLAQTTSSGAETLAHGRFRDLEIYRPAGEPHGVVLFVSDKDGWSPPLAALARALAHEGTLVAGIDLPKLSAQLQQDTSSCMFLDGDLENLGHFLQAYYLLPDYEAPLLAGYGLGATLVYAMLAQAPAGTFAGGISLAFCPSFPLHEKLCAGEGLRVSRGLRGSPDQVQPARSLAAPWRVVQGSLDKRCGAASVRPFLHSATDGKLTLFPGAQRRLSQAPVWTSALLDAYRSLRGERNDQGDGAYARHATSDGLAGGRSGSRTALPVVEVPAAAQVARVSESLALILSGDGGWAGIDKALAHSLAARGVPVVGFDSLRYFWTARTPASTAADIERLLRRYLDSWGKRDALLIGYSQGADVLPFVVNRLSEPLRARLRLVALLGPGRHAQFEFHPLDWLPGGNDSGLAIRPEAERIDAPHVLCIYGRDEDVDESLCPQLSGGSVQILELPGGHHFGGDYDRLAALLLQHAR